MESSATMPSQPENDDVVGMDEQSDEQGQLEGQESSAVGSSYDNLNQVYSDGEVDDMGESGLMQSAQPDGEDGDDFDDNDDDMSYREEVEADNAQFAADEPVIIPEIAPLLGATALPPMDVTGPVPHRNQGSKNSEWVTNNPGYNPGYSRAVSLSNTATVTSAGIPCSPAVRPKTHHPKVPKVHSRDNLLSYVGSDETDRAVSMSQPLDVRPRNAFRKQSTVPPNANITIPVEPPEEQFGEAPQQSTDDEFFQDLKHGNPYKDRKDSQRAQQTMYDQLKYMYEQRGDYRMKDYEIEEVDNDPISYKRVSRCLYANVLVY